MRRNVAIKSSAIPPRGSRPNPIKRKSSKMYMSGADMRGCLHEEEVTMDNQDFISKCKDLVAGYANERLDKTDGKKIGKEDVYVVWSCKTLQNNKALLSTTLPDGMYYELTLNGDKREIYLDAYKKWENVKYNV